MRRVPLIIDLDFLPKRRASNVFGWTLFVLGVIVFGLVLADFRLQRKALAQEEEAVARLRDSQRRSVVVPAANARYAVSSEETAAALETARRLGTDWGRVFSALTVAQSDSVSWISLDAEPSRTRLRIAGDARSMPALFEFMALLGKADEIGGVSLSSYERMHTGSVDLVRFNIDANWSGER